MWINLDTSSGAALALRQVAQDTINVASPASTTASKVWTKPMIRALVWTWLSLNIVGQVLLLLLLATFFFGRRLKSKRHPTVLNFVFTHLLSTIPACMLLYGNGHLDKQPDPSLCLFNAALEAAVAPMVSLSFFAVVLQVYSLMRAVTAKKEYVQRTWVTALLIAMPYVAFVGFGLATGIVGFMDPDNVTRAEIVYCSVRGHNLGIYIWTPTICVVVATLGVGIALVVLLWRNWRDVKGNSVVDFNLVVRALCFTVFELFLIVTFMLAIFENNIVPKFMSAVAPIGVFLIFSTQPDVIHSWFPCCARSREDFTMIRTSSIPPLPPKAPLADEEKFSPEYTFQGTVSSKPSALRGVPGLRVSTISLPQPIPSSDYAGSPASGLRNLSLASSAASSPRFAGRPTHSPSLSDASIVVTLRPESRPRAPGLHHGRNNSAMSLSGQSSYSDLSWKSNGSSAPLIQTVDGMRRPSDRSQSSSHLSATGVLGNVSYEHNRV